MLLREWSNPELVRRSRWRLRSYYIGLLIMLCAVPLVFITAVTRSAWGSVAILFCGSFGLWLASLHKRCSYCNYVPDHRTDPSDDFYCEGCGALAYGQKRYSPVSTEAPRWEDLVTDPKQYWTDPQVVARYKWRRRVAWLVVGVALFVFYGLAVCGATGLACDPFGVNPVAYLLLGTAFLGAFLIPSLAARCPYCGDRFNSMSRMMGGVCCHGCGFVLLPVNGWHMQAGARQRSRTAAPAARTGDIDPLEEADTLLLFNRVPQAVKLLEDALHRDPSRADIAERLAEILKKQ